MATGYTGKNELNSATPIALGLSDSDIAVSKIWRLSERDSTCLRVDIISSFIEGTPIAHLETSWDGDTWVRSKNVTIDNGIVSLTLLVERDSDQQYLPLRPLARIVIVQDGLSQVTIDRIQRSFYG
jgi:hypothetical protein